MPSRSLQVWQTHTRRALDQVEAARAAVRVSGPRRRFAAQQIAQFYPVLLSAHFQRFCRDLHTECAEHVIASVGLLWIEPILRNRLLPGRRLDAGNPNPANIGADFGWLGLPLWDQIAASDPRNRDRRRALEELNGWRNAVAHFDYRKPGLSGQVRVRVSDMKRWRAACDALTVELDRECAMYFASVTGRHPW